MFTNVHHLFALAFLRSSLVTISIYEIHIYTLEEFVGILLEKQIIVSFVSF